MGREWDLHDFDDPDENPVTRFRHLGGDYGPYDPMYHENGDMFGLESDDDFGSDGAPDFNDYPSNPKDTMTKAGYIVRYDTWRFVPQWDFHMLGTKWRYDRAKWDFDNPPSPAQPDHASMRNKFKYCQKCELTWLVGHSGLKEHTHPSHWAFSEDPEDIDLAINDLGIESSLVVHMASASAGDHTSMSIFYGDNSKYNSSERFQNSDGTSIGKAGAELKAAVHIMKTVRDTIAPERQVFINAKTDELEAALEKRERDRAEKTPEKREKAEKTPEKKDKAEKTREKRNKAEKTPEKSSEADQETAQEKRDKAEKASEKSLEADEDEAEWESESESEDKEENSDSDDDKDADDFHDFRIIIVTDCAEVVNNVCTHQHKWKMGQNNILRNKQGKPIKSSAEYIALEDLRLELAKKGTSIKWYLVDKKFNADARALAAKAVTEG